GRTRRDRVVRRRPRAACSVAESPAPYGAAPPSLGAAAREALRLRHLSPRTEQAYLHWMQRYVRYHRGRHPRELSAEHLTAFLSSLATAGRVSASTQNQVLAALLFLYREVLGAELPWLDDIVRAKSPARLPIVLARDEVAAVLAQLAGPPRLMATL